MIDGDMIKTLIENAPIPTIIFLIWYLYHRAETKKWMAVTKQQEANNARMFKLLEDFLAKLDLQGQILQRMDTKMTMCMPHPMRREFDATDTIKEAASG